MAKRAIHTWVIESPSTYSICGLATIPGEYCKSPLSPPFKVAFPWCQSAATHKKKKKKREKVNKLSLSPTVGGDV